MCFEGTPVEVVLVSGFRPPSLAAVLVAMKLWAATEGPWAPGLPWADAPWVLPGVVPEPKLLLPCTEEPCCFPPPLDEDPPPNWLLKVP